MSAIIKNPTNTIAAGPISLNSIGGGIYLATASIPRLTISNAGAVDILGSLLLQDGTQGAGKVLTSDALGAATWQSLPADSLFVDLETPSGTIDGVNTVFTLAHTPASEVYLWVNGILMNPNGNDFTVSGSTLNLVFAPASGDVLLTSYRW